MDGVPIGLVFGRNIIQSLSPAAKAEIEKNAYYFKWYFRLSETIKGVIDGFSRRGLVMWIIHHWRLVLLIWFDLSLLFMPLNKRMLRRAGILGSEQSVLARRQRAEQMLREMATIEQEVQAEARREDEAIAELRDNHHRNQIV